MTTHEDLLAELRKDPEFVTTESLMAPYFAIIQYVATERECLCLSREEYGLVVEALNDLALEAVGALPWNVAGIALRVWTWTVRRAYREAQ